MSHNDADVVLITRDRHLRELVARHCPRSARLRCLVPTDLENSPPLRADHWWVDLDCGTAPETGQSRGRAYFYSHFPEEPNRLPAGLLLRKPCDDPAVALLWARVTAPPVQPLATPDRRKLPDARLLPAWLLDLHELDLRKLCHKCVEELPPRLGYAEIALYLYDAEQDVLTLAETNSKRQVDLAIPLTAENKHALAVVARTGQPLVAPDLAAACRAAGMCCPSGLEGAPRRAAVLVPLIARDRLYGLVQLNDRHRTDRSEVGLPLDHVFGFLARCFQHARQYLRVRVEARVDRLTGLFNYRWMREALGKEIRRAQRYGSPLAVILVDLDGLKAVNDRFGHAGGDALLRHTAGKISAALRQIDSAARIGGDEFVVLLPATDINGARHVARRIVTAIRTDAPLIEEKPLRVAASLGVAQWEDGWDEEQLIRAADQAMYAAKRKGRNRLACHPRQSAAKPARATRAGRAK